MTSILSKIAKRKREEVETAKQTHPLERLKSNPLLPTKDFVAALNSNNPAIIAEIKKASPSKGIICNEFDVPSIAKSYETNGASCLSVLTDIDFFQGHPSYLKLAKSACQLPILRKDFIIDAYQIYESRALGADSILLIVALLDDAQLMEYCQLAQALDMAVLVESHSLAELERALELPTPLMGINNRSLHTFDTDIQTSINLKQYIPNDKIIICESGINTHADIRHMQAHEITTFLVGESLMRATNIGNALHELIHG